MIEWRDGQTRDSSGLLRRVKDSHPSIVASGLGRLSYHGSLKNRFLLLGIPTALASPSRLNRQWVKVGTEPFQRTQKAGIFENERSRD